FCREAVVWKRLIHPNIVPFIGVEPRNQACIVSEWMDNGDIMSYLEDHPRANRIDLITDIARGLNYMHASGLVHGDLKSRNVLVDKIGRARLSDFGLATTILGTASLAATAGSSANWGSICYMAPELNDHMAKNKILTSKSDVYAFGMTTWEIFDGRHPFYDVQNVFVILRQVLDGTRPTRPVHAQDLGLDDFIWEVVISSCWLADPSERPDMSEVLAWLGPYNSAQGLVAKLVHEGLSDADRQVLDQLLFTGES
ncbi:kinase-like protein, partial [Punctularia strigosozonata HHB-11173 SS5]